MKTFFVWTTLCICIHFSCNANHQQNSELALQNQTHKISTTKTDPNTSNIQVALLLDTSNSMDGLISQAKSQLWSIVNKLSDAKIKDEKAELQIALYEYGNDGLQRENGFIRRH